MTTNITALDKVFSKEVFTGLMTDGSSDIFDSAIQEANLDTENQTYYQLYTELYSYIGRNHRSEYFHMNNLLNKLLEICDQKNDKVLTHLRIGDCPVDMALLRGSYDIESSEAYIVKATLNNPDRLPTVINEYFKVFTHVIVKAHDKGECERLDKFLHTEMGEIGDKVGLFYLKDDLSYKRLRRCEKYSEGLDHSAIFNCMSIDEYQNLIVKYFIFSSPIGALGFHTDDWLRYFNAIPLCIAHKMAFTEMNSNRRGFFIFQLNQLPKEFKALLYSTKLSQEYDFISKMFSSPYKHS